jgi:hypothetical protein
MMATSWLYGILSNNPLLVHPKGRGWLHASGCAEVEAAARRLALLSW